MNQEKPQTPLISVAPMMDWTDRHCRYFHRLISPHALLYTEMITTGALIHGDRERFLRFSPEEHPLALQLGGSEPADLALCAKMGADAGYDEINLNCGCPSERVQKGAFGACLMKEADLVADCITAMVNAVNIPVTVKCRLGVDEYDSVEFLDDFITTVKSAGCKTFIVHARKAWLKGLSPKENRTKPPIDYGRVELMKQKHPDLTFIVNGEIKTVEDVKAHLNIFDGVMIGREAYQNPYLLSDLEREILGNDHVRGREKIARAMIPYIAQQMQDHNTPVKSITRHMIGLFHERKGAKKWRQILSTLPHQDSADEKLIEHALMAVL
jgi:tRNA-dihydrouridine synthase A